MKEQVDNIIIKSENYATTIANKVFTLWFYRGFITKAELLQIIGQKFTDDDLLVGWDNLNSMWIYRNKKIGSMLIMPDLKVLTKEQTTTAMHTLMRA